MVFLRNFTFEAVHREVPVLVVRDDAVNGAEFVLDADVAKLLEVLVEFAEEMLLVSVSAFHFDHVERHRGRSAAAHNLVVWLDHLVKNFEFNFHVHIHSRLLRVVIQLAAHKHQHCVDEDSGLFLDAEAMRLSSEQPDPLI
jgi:hypothetical protein